MRAKFPGKVERGRIRDGQFASSKGDCFGAFFVQRNGTTYKVIASDGSEEIPWEHVSVSLPSRTPTWEEICWIKSLFWDDDECVMQLHVPRADWINYHPNCLHLWKPTREAIPRPPHIAV